MLRTLTLLFFVLLFPSRAWAGKLEVVQKLVASGKCADAVARVDEWVQKSALGNEEAELLKARAEAAYCSAKAINSVPEWEAYLSRFSEWPEAQAARIRLWNLAFVSAQAEGTRASMKAFVTRYPESPMVDQARKQEEAWAFDDAARSDDLRAAEAFVAEYPNSPLRAQAWETLVQKSPGIYLIAADGEPRRLEPAVIEGDRIVMPVGLPAAGARPVVGVNLPGAGRGETSQWWSLKAITYDAEGVARLGDIAPLGVEIASRLGLPPPGPEAELLRMVPAAGSHVARVATTRAPLATPGHCPGSGRFAFVLETPGASSEAFPFGVTCPGDDEPASSVSVLFDILDAAEAGDRALARERWGALTAMVEAGELRSWLRAVVDGDPYAAMVDSRPSVGDWIVWTSTPDGAVISRWLRAEDTGSKVLAMRSGWAVVSSGALRTTIGDPRCARLWASIGSTLFCDPGDGGHAVSFDGATLPLPPPAAQTLAEEGFPLVLPADAIVAAGPRWRGGQLVATWRLRTTVQADVWAEAPESWSRTLGATPALSQWLTENVRSAAFGVSVVAGDPVALYRAFAAP